MTPPARFVAAALAASLASCTSNTAPAGEAVFRVAVVDESFHILLRDSAIIREAEHRMADENGRGIVTGRLARGDGGFNQPWSWHLVPETVEFADVTIELCDGKPSAVEQDLDYWLDTVGTYCPWSGHIVARVR